VFKQRVSRGRRDVGPPLPVTPDVLGMKYTVKIRYNTRPPVRLGEGTWDRTADTSNVVVGFIDRGMLKRGSAPVFRSCRGSDQASYRTESLQAKAVPCAAPTAMRFQMFPLDQFAKVLLQGVATATGQSDGLGHGNTPVLAGKFNDLQRQFGQRCQHDFLALDFLLEPAHLFGK
jgi:hypothetical protein